MAQLRRAIRDLWRTVAREAPPVRTRRVTASESGQGSKSIPSRHRTAFDEWAVLQNLKGTAATQLLREEEDAAAAFFADTGPFEQRLQAEAASLLLPEAHAPPEVNGGFRYFQRYTPEGHVVFCREPLRGGSEEKLLDAGAVAQEMDASHAEIAVCKVSDDHKVLGYIVDTLGDESYDLCFRTLGPGGAVWSIRLPHIRSFEFLGDGCPKTGLGILAVGMDAQTKRANRISYIRVMQESTSNELLLWEERNDAAYLEVYRTKDKHCVLMSSNTKDTSEVRAVRCGSPDTNQSDIHQQVLLSRREGVEYFAEHSGKHFFVISNHERPDFRVYRLSDEDLGVRDDGNWPLLETYFDPPGNLHVTDADMLSKWLVLYGHEDASPRICVLPLHEEGSSKDAEASGSYLADLPSNVGSVEPGVNAERTAEKVRFTFRSPLEPSAVFDLDLASGGIELINRHEWSPNTGYSPEHFSCERLYYPSRDGEWIPLTLVRARQQDTSSTSRPCLLQVYGAYGSCLAPDYRPEHMLLLRRGWAIAWAHVRGGGERGRAWHAAARQLKKGRSVEDLADAVKFLLARGVAAPGALCIKAASAGGLTLGALLNSPSEASLVAAAILEVPFVDALTGMLDPTLPLTVHEFSEWGDPKEVVHEENLKSLSPYENVGSHSYPQIYISCALADARVPAWMPLKYAARLRARSVGYLDNALGGARRRAAMKIPEASTKLPVVVLNASDGGHGGASDWHGRSEEFARQIVFLHKAIDMPLR